MIGEAEAEKVRVTRLDLADGGAGDQIWSVCSVRSVRVTDLPPGWRQAVMVIGIEQRLDYSSGREGFTVSAPVEPAARCSA